ncbi:MAG TPA: outer membrane beta-barrel protein [Candidatus Dormibacteraeota bacterium]|nr:outer membrane beta-barrel protein [Candidatus Dormibacteraeota bacterium]
MKRTLSVSLLMAAALAASVNGIQAEDYAPYRYDTPRSQVELTIAEEAPRVERLDAFVVGQYLTGTFKPEAGGSRNFSGWAGGLGIGYNFTPHLNLNADAEGGHISLSGGGADSIQANAGFDFYLSRTRLTPFITGSIGLIYLNGSTSRSFSNNDGTESSSFDDVNFTTGVGGGFRYDITDRIFAKAFYRANWGYFPATRGATLYHTINVAVGISL